MNTTVAARQGSGLLQSHLGLIQQLIDQVANRRGLGREEREEFNSIAWLKLIENQEAIFGGFRGDCKLRTYLYRVIDRTLLDYRISKWGKWRPSAHAERAGSQVSLLERLLHRDRYTLREAVAILQTNFRWSLSSAQITEMATNIRATPIRQRLCEKEIELLADPGDGAEEGVQRAERGIRRSAAQAILRQAISSLSQVDRRLLRLRFGEGLSVAEIARRLGKDQKRLYRRMSSVLRRLRQSLESCGLGKEELSWLVGCKSGEIQPCLDSRKLLK